MYRCVNCGKERLSFQCDCGEDESVWNKDVRKNKRKRKNARK